MASISDIGLDYFVCAGLALASFVIIAESGRRLGRTRVFKKKIIQPLVQVRNAACSRLLVACEHMLSDVTATRTTWSSSNSYFQGSLPHFRRRLCASARFPVRRTLLGRRHCYLLALMAVSGKGQVSAFSSDVRDIGPRESILVARYDTDSFTLGLDTCSTRGIGFHKSQFKDLRPWKGPPVKGVGTAPIEGVGTMYFSMECDAGIKHTLEVKDCVYVPTMPKALMSPQWLATNCDWTDTNMTSLLTDKDGAKLRFGPKGEYTLTAWHDPLSGVPDIKVNHGINNYNDFADHVDIQCNTSTLEEYFDPPLCKPCDTHKSSTVHAMPAYLVAPDDDDNQLDVTEEQTALNEAIRPLANDEMAPHLITPVASLDEDDVEDLTPPHELDPHERHNHTENTIIPPSVTAETIDIENVDFIEPEEDSVLEDQPDLAAATAQGELLRLHYRFGHLSFAKLQAMAKRGIIPRSLAKIKPPVCAACMFGKLSRRNWRTRATNRKRIYKATSPGQVVSVDQMESTAVGFVGQLKGRMTKRRYKYATVFIDHFSGYSYVHVHSLQTSEETLIAKKAFEAHAAKYGVNIRHYHCDNGRFVDKAWINHVQKVGQTISYCGVNAHFQNGRAEKLIRDIREGSRTTLIFAQRKWAAIDMALWPYALRYENDVRNNVPGKDNCTNFMRFTSTNELPNYKDFHAFGCPVYALDSTLAAGKSIAHWDKRARIGINLGFSPRHASTVSLILNTQTGTVSPQFHIKHDDFFTSVSQMDSTVLWKRAAGLDGSPPPPTPQPAPTPTAHVSFKGVERHHVDSTQPQDPDQSGSNIEGAQLPATDEALDSETALPHPAASREQQHQPSSASPTVINMGPSFHTDDPTGDDSTILPATSDTSTRRSSRRRTPSTKYKESVEMGALRAFPASLLKDEAYYDALHEDEYVTQKEMNDPIAFLASTQSKSKGDPDTMYYHQAMAAPDREQFKTAMRKEFADHCTRDHWEIVTTKKVPKGVRILDAVWAMRRKRNIKTREIYKWKARLNVHGGQQEKGVNFWETYSPVVNWFSIRLLLAKALLHNWHTRQIDFVMAYPQADIETELFMKLPAGIELPGLSNDTHCLRLKKNLYGQKQAGRVWVKHLQQGLRNLGFTPSAIDECVWYRDDVIFTFYVDDGIAWSPNKASVDKFIDEFRNVKMAGAKYDIEDMGDVTDYLGINFSKLPGDRIHLSQPHLIDDIIKEVGVLPYKPRTTPALSSSILHRDLDGEEFTYQFDYRSIIGKLNFLEKGTRPDIAYAVHQLARFSSCPKKCHGDAVIHLAKYLKGTRSRGIIIKPDFSKSFEVYADADFAGNWHAETAALDASTAKSRAGYVVTLHGCPIIWHSKLINQICLSTTEAEYCCLSQALRDTIPIMNLLKELNEHSFKSEGSTPKIHCQLFEDNMGALEIARTPKMRPRTKHINNVYHHFREHVRMKLVTITYVPTTEQTADMLTKPLGQNLFQKFRKRLMGW